MSRQGLAGWLGTRAAGILLGLSLWLLATDALAARRVAVIVGANAAVPGRPALRYAYLDAESVAQALLDVADFAPADIEVFRDGTPEAILTALDRRLDQLRAAPGETLLVFYFSGHGDGDALYSGGAPISLSALKARLSDPAAKVRLGIVDACSGGAWTGAKGLRPAEEFSVEVPFVLGSEGSALLAASSGLDDAHESEVISGSFFTHHLVAALRGAADRSGDGEIGLHDAFDYARPLTIRDSALLAGRTQRPSFEFNLRGRRDLILARIARSPNQLAIEQQEGPLQLLRLDSGLLVLETAAGPGRIVAALPPGRYLLRRQGADGSWARELHLDQGARLAVSEGELARVGGGALASKGAAHVEASTLAAGAWALQAAMGRVISGARYTGAADAELGGFVDLRVGVSDRVQLSPLYLGVAWRLGSPGHVELILHTESEWGAERRDVFAFPAAGALTRLYLGADHSVVAGGSLRTALALSEPSQGFERWLGSIQAGWILRFGEKVSLAAGASVGDRWDEDERRTTGRFRPGTTVVELGSALRLGTARMPVVSVELFDGVAAEGHALVSLDLEQGSVHESFLGGLTWSF